MKTNKEIWRSFISDRRDSMVFQPIENNIDLFNIKISMFYEEDEDYDDDVCLVEYDE